MLTLAIDACTNVSFLATVLFLKKIIKIISYIVPVILILLMTIDIAKAVIASDDNQMKKAQNLAIKRIVWGIVIFFVPIVVNAVFSLFDGKEVAGITCYNNASDEVVNTLYLAENEKLLKYQNDINELIEAAKVGKEASDKKLAELRVKATEIQSSYGVSGATKYTLANGKVAEAARGDKGRTGIKGDQSGNEVWKKGKLPKKATYIARFKNPQKAEITARCGEAGADNNHIGYGVNGFSSLYNEAKKVNWDLSKINKNVNTVCSTFVSVCINAAGTEMDKNLNGYAKNQKKFEKTGDFEIIKPYSKSKVMRGDIIVWECSGNCGHMSIAR